jgi:16S rRNA (guanine966-N2)-methyltransferase
VRPTSDRVRESIFDILGSMGGVEGLAVADLFCGSGALGAEALSRGASSVTFVDHDHAAVAAVADNLGAVGLGSATATVIRAELPGWLSRAGRFDLALCDPPYSFSDWGALLGCLDADRCVLESGSPIELTRPWVITKTRRYGSTLVTVAQREASTTADPPAS